jgi:hypothetical protein
MMSATYSTTHYENYKQIGDLNYFEEIIESMIIDGISGMNDSFRNAINSLPRDQKRMAILSLLDKDLNLFKRIKALTNKNINKMEHIKDIILMLREYVKVGEVEKKKFGEVMTPLELVKEMLLTLPENVWSDPNLKWLDPANGTGPYPIMVIYKLMNGLKDWEPDEEKRYKHIIEKMIYVAELQPKNMFLYMCAVDPFDSYKLNIYTGSFLGEGFDYHTKEVWGIEKFDIVIGNPPYNQMIDMDFLCKSHDISDIILYVHPSTWLLDEKSKQKKFLTTKDKVGKDLVSITLFNGNKMFRIALFVPCVITYINKNIEHEEIKCSDKVNNKEIKYMNIYEINKFSNNFEYFSIKRKIKIASDKDNLLNNKNIDKGQYYVNIAQIRGNVIKNSDDKMVKDDFYTLITKDTIVNSIKEKHMFFSFTTQLEAENFLSYIKTDFCRFCLSIYKNNSQLDRGELGIIPWLDFRNKWGDKELECEFNLTHDEIKFIKKSIPKYY